MDPYNICVFVLKMDPYNRRVFAHKMEARKVCLVISPRNASGSREVKKNGVGMALDVATLPLILYRKVYNH